MNSINMGMRKTCKQRGLDPQKGGHGKYQWYRHNWVLSQKLFCVWLETFVLKHGSKNQLQDGEMAQGVREHLAHKNEDLHSDSQHLHKKPGVVSVLWRVLIEISRGLVGSQPSSRFSERPCLRKKENGRAGHYSHMQMGMYSPMQTHTPIK